MSKNIDWGRLFFILFGIIAFIVTFILTDHPDLQYTGVLEIMVTVFSILAGIIIAVITILGDPALLYRGSWRIASAHRRQIRKRLHRYAILFYVYLIVIGFALATAFTINISAAQTWAFFFERCALSAGVSAFIWSLGLPVALIRTQMERLDEEVKKR